jgi:hypothetical protein
MARDITSGNAGVQIGLDRDERWLLIERVISSAPFRKAGRLRELLRYLAHVCLPAEGSVFTDHDLTEQKIGQAVFGKPAGYSPVEDSSVRVHMRQLRLKLHEYFDSEGRDEALVVEIPRGSYILVFHAIPAPAPAAPAPSSPLPRLRPAPALLLLWSALLLLAAAGVFFLAKSRAPATPQTAPWPLSAVFANGRRTQIVLADATYSIRRILSQKPASLEDYLQRDFRQRPDASPLKQSGMKQPGSYLESYSADALLTSWADVAVATSFLKLLPGRLDLIAVRSARDLRLRELEEGNYVFLGSPASNPWVLLFENRLNFQEVRGDETHGVVRFFRNREPRPGEQPTYRGLPRTGADGEDYAAIALLPSESRPGNILIIQGLQQEATEAAGLFLADEGGRRNLRAALGSSAQSPLPAYFEVLLRIQAVGGSASSTSIVASRIVKP